MTVKIKSRITNQRVDDGKRPAKAKVKELVKRPAVLSGSTYKRRYPNSDSALYITINDISEVDAEGKETLKPHEIILNSKDMSHYQWTVCLTRIMSAVMRQGGDVSFLAEELKNVFDPRGGFMVGNKQVASVVADIGNTIEEHLIEIGTIQQPVVVLSEEKQAMKNAGIPDSAAFCPKCNVKALVRIDGCMTCLNCGDSKCGG